MIRVFALILIAAIPYTASAHGDEVRVQLSATQAQPGTTIDAVDGVYEVRVTDTHHVAGATVHIMTDLNGDEAGSQRAEEEPLLAPMPTRATGMILPSSQTSTAPPTAAAGERSAAWLVLPLGTLALAGLALALKRRSVR